MKPSNVTRANYLIILSALFTILLSCSGQPERHVLTIGPIEHFGIYTSTDKITQLSVFEENSIVKYKMIYNKKIVIESNDNIGSFQRWFFFWDSKENLWIYSADIGTSVWAKDQQGNYTQYGIKDRPIYCNPVPPIIYNKWHKL